MVNTFPMIWNASHNVRLTCNYISMASRDYNAITYFQNPIQDVCNDIVCLCDNTSRAMSGKERFFFCCCCLAVSSSLFAPGSAQIQKPIISDANGIDSFSCNTIIMFLPFRLLARHSPATYGCVAIIFAVNVFRSRSKYIISESIKQSYMAFRMSYMPNVCVGTVCGNRTINETSDS